MTRFDERTRLTRDRGAAPSLFNSSQIVEGPSELIALTAQLSNTADGNDALGTQERSKATVF